ncbi:MAG: hypothetical protein JST86_16750 [Bacteroidetes bacterium]|nr:hypothetical protein [Bacteroidota bacterium]
MKQNKFISALTVLAVLFLTACNNSTDEKKTAPASGADTSKPATTTAPATVTNGPGNYLVVMHKVGNFEKWLPLYESDDSARKANGLTSYVICRGLDKDSNMILVSMHMADTAKAKAFIASDALKAKMKAGGVEGMPEITFSENVIVDTTTVPNNMPRVMISHTVKDWTAWKKAYDEHAQARTDAGLMQRIVAHALGDDHQVRLVFAIQDMAKAKAFSASKDLKDKMTAAGVVGPPTFFYFTVVKKY